MVVALPARDMAADEQYAAGAKGMMASIASQVASICSMIDEHEATDTPFVAGQLDAILAMIDDVAPAAAASERTTSPRSTSCYEDLGMIGEGSTAVVTKARHLATGHTVALKTIREYCRSVSGGELLREACLMAACRGHPSIVAIHGIALANNNTNDLSLVMEHVGGATLDRVLRERDRPFTEREVRSVMRQLLSWAEAMHGHGVVHRDIKTENVLVANDGNVKIADFGSAMSVAAAEKTTGSGAYSAYVSAGTTHCSEPEMLMETPGYDARVDSWSLGCLMAELLTGETLFDGKCDSDQLHMIYDVIGVPGKEEWRRYESSFVAGKVPLWRQEQEQQRRRGRWHGNRLRELFPEEMLSDQGFEVLKGLLTCNPDKRLTAAATLQLPWFDDNAPVEN